MQIIFKYCMRFACSTLSINFNTFRLFEKRNEAENEGMVLDTVFCLPGNKSDQKTDLAKPVCSLGTITLVSQAPMRHVRCVVSRR